MSKPTLPRILIVTWADIITQAVQIKHLVVNELIDNINPIRTFIYNSVRLRNINYFSKSVKDLINKEIEDSIGTNVPSEITNFQSKTFFIPNVGDVTYIWEEIERHGVNHENTDV